MERFGIAPASEFFVKSRPSKDVRPNMPDDSDCACVRARARVCVSVCVTVAAGTIDFGNWLHCKQTAWPTLRESRAQEDGVTWHELYCSSNDLNGVCSS